LRWPRQAGAQWPRPDFLPQPKRPPWLAWAWLICGALALALAVDDWITLIEARSVVERQIARWRPASAARVAAAPGAAATAPAGAASAAVALTRRLAHPWQTLFETTERYAPVEVQWLRLEHDADRGDLRLEAVAPSRDAVRTTLDSLTGAGGLDDVMLVRVEVAGASTAAPPGLRFELRARFGAATDAANAQESR
jgi:hypothetical protein